MNHLRYIGKCECSCSIWSFGCGKIQEVIETLWRDTVRLKTCIARQMRFKVER